jgi:hypothetical protein
MIAVVSSTVSPSLLPSHDGARTTLSPEIRLEQTRGTVESLLAIGVREIVIADNSPGTWLQERVASLAPARVVTFRQPPVRNKGIGELWLLLGCVDELPEDEQIMKISGRYRVGGKTELALRDEDDVAAKVFGANSSEEISTRCYLLRNRAVAARLWGRALDEMYAERSRIVGPRSLLRIVRNSVNPQADSFPYSDPNTKSLERATLVAIRHLRLRLRAVGNLDVEGTLGSWINPAIKE